MTITRRQFSLTAGVALATAALGTASGSAAARFTAKSGMPLSSISYVAQDFAIASGFMEEEGLDLEAVNAGGGSNLRDLVGSGQIEFGVADSAHPLLLTNRGRPAKILLSLDNRSPLASIVIRQELFDQGIDTVAKLAAWQRPDGSKPIFGVTSLGGGQHVYISYFAEQQGIADSFLWVAGGGEATILGGLSTGQFDAIAAMPNIRMVAENRKWGQVVFDVGDTEAWNRAYGGPVPSTVAFTLQSTIDREPEMVQAYVNAMYRSLQWLKNASKEDIYDAVAKLYLGDFSEETIRNEIAFLEPLHSYSGDVDEEQFANLAPILFRDMTAMKAVSYEDAVNSRFLEAAKEAYGG